MRDAQRVRILRHFYAKKEDPQILLSVVPDSGGENIAHILAREYSYYSLQFIANKFPSNFGRLLQGTDAHNRLPIDLLLQQCLDHSTPISRDTQFLTALMLMAPVRGNRAPAPSNPDDPTYQEWESRIHAEMSPNNPRTLKPVHSSSSSSGGHIFQAVIVNAAQLLTNLKQIDDRRLELLADYAPRAEELYWRDKYNRTFITGLVSDGAYKTLGYILVNFPIVWFRLINYVPSAPTTSTVPLTLLNLQYSHSGNDSLKQGRLLKTMRMLTDNGADTELPFYSSVFGKSTPAVYRDAGVSLPGQPLPLPIIRAGDASAQHGSGHRRVRRTSRSKNKRRPCKNKRTSARNSHTIVLIHRPV
jgi:hypothetical protein